MKACCLEAYNEGYNRGLEYKEQEIINLLDILKPKACCAYCEPSAEKAKHYLSEIQALIKGENK